jgi:hypothetical protein
MIEETFIHDATGQPALTMQLSLGDVAIDGPPRAP